MKHRFVPLLAMTIALMGCGCARAQALSNQSIATGAVQLLRYAIHALATRTGPGDPQYFAGGVWHSADDGGLWNYQVGPGAAAAVLWRTTGEKDSGLLRMAETTFDQAIAKHELGNGSFGPGSDGMPGTQSPDVATIWFGSELGTTYLELAPALGPRRRARWLRALTRAADYLETAGDVTWYINGNDNLGEAEVYYTAWRASGDPRYQKDYDADLNFTLHPSQARWPGDGLRMLPGPAPFVHGVQLIGPAGYLAESDGTDPPGFDPYYTVTQMDAATRLFVLSGDPRVLRLADMSVNADMPLVDDTWTLNTSGGTRHTGSAGHCPFLTPALAVLGWLGSRPDLARVAASQFGLIDEHYRATSEYVPPDYMALSDEVAVILQAVAKVDPAALANVPASYSRLW